MNISVFGAGYVGLVSAVCLAEIGHSVICIDNNIEKLNALKQGIIPIFEAGLQPLLDKHLSEGNIKFTQNPIDAIQQSDIQMIAVGTPINANANVNLDYVYDVSQTIAQHLSQKSTIVLKSTCPPGTTKAIKRYINQLLNNRKVDFSIDVASNPEFLQEGTAIQQFMYPDRIIIGAEDIETIQKMHDLYHPLINDNNHLVIMDSASAELTKYSSNAFLAAKISFINEISQIAERVGADINAVKTGLGLDYRINENFLNAGCGFGGSCFPKDVITLIATAKQHHVKPYMLESIIKRNIIQQELLFHKISHFFQQELSNKTIALWGLTFKPGTDDIRYATSRVVIDLFLKAGANVQAFDPMGMEEIGKLYQQNDKLKLCSSPIDAIDQADVLAICTEWPEFNRVPLSEIKRHLHHQAIFDGRNMLSAEKVKQHQLQYFGVGIGDNFHQKQVESA